MKEFALDFLTGIVVGISVMVDHGKYVLFGFLIVLQIAILLTLRELLRQIKKMRQNTPYDYRRDE